jgi:succinate-semialdehyde dehydrogenase/glutarate-semialdehyde dehydrogenase
MTQTGKLTTVDPTTGAPLRDYAVMSDRELDAALSQSAKAFRDWKARPVAERTEKVARLAQLFEAEAPHLGALATKEMGKPLVQAIAEAKKCAVGLRYYAENGERMLRDEPVAVDAPARAAVVSAPLGPILAIMPWNFPWWQVVRLAAPALTAGNTVLLKHSENTTGVALELEALTLRAGLPEGVFRTLVIEKPRIEAVIKGPVVAAVSLTGSEGAGRAVAAQAGSALKKCVLELGGSDPYVVLADADVEAAAKICADSRLQNNGQSCVAAKRFIVVAPVYDAFVAAFLARVREKKVLPPTDPGCDVGPMARRDLRDGLDAQVKASVAAGAEVALAGGPDDRPGFWYRPVVLTGVLPGMKAYDEETFGPAAAITRAKDEAEAFELAATTRFGLGAALFSRDVERARRLAAERLEAGFCAVNTMVVSDPRLPFGGIKASGYGRELSAHGLREFLNLKTVVAKG